MGSPHRDSRPNHEPASDSDPGPTNVVQVSHLYRPSIGGIENYGHRLVDSLEDAGRSVSIITTDASLSNGQSPLGTESNVTYCSTTATVLRNPFSIELYQQVKQSDAALYHLHSPWYLSTLEAVLALPPDTPMVMTIHGFQPIQSATARLLDTAYRPFAQYVLDRVDRTIVLGESEKQRLVHQFDVDPNDVAVVPNGIHPDDHDVPPDAVDRIQATYDVDPTTPTVLYVSRLVPLKGPDVLVDAITQHCPDADLDVVVVGNGDDDYAAELKARADDRFTFLSNLPFDDLQALYHAADLFALPSKAEGLPTVVLEAMNARLPIITTPVGALADVITHRENGWLLDDAPDAESLATAITHYLDHPDDRRTTGAHNRTYVRNEFDWTDIAADIDAIYADVLDQPKPEPPTPR